RYQKRELAFVWYVYEWAEPFDRTSGLGRRHRKRRVRTIKSHRTICDHFPSVLCDCNAAAVSIAQVEIDCTVVFLDTQRERMLWAAQAGNGLHLGYQRAQFISTWAMLTAAAL